MTHNRTILTRSKTKSQEFDFDNNVLQPTETEPKLTRPDNSSSNTNILLQSSMELDFTPTEEDGVEAIFIDTPLRQTSSTQPINFGFDETDSDTDSAASSSKSTHNNKGKGKEITPPIQYRPVDWQVEYGRHRYKMFAAMSEIPGTSEDSKIRLISKALARLESFISIRAVTNSGTKQIVALFGSANDAHRARKIKIDNETTIHMQEGTIHNTFEAKHKTIRAWDIPLNVSQQDVRSAFSKYGEIKSIKLQTIGMWQSANIEYTNQEEYDKLASRWSIPFKADLIRIYPFLNTKEIKQERSQYALRLINLPPGTTGYDMKTIIRDYKAQTCYIPRNSDYRRKRFAILSFKDNKDLEKAKQSKVQLGNTELQWLDITTKTCTICSNPQHLARDCPIKEQQSRKIQEKKENFKKFGHLYSRFKPSGTNTSRRLPQPNKSLGSKSFADIVKQRSTTKSNQNKPKPLSNQNKPQPSFSEMISAISELRDVISDIKQEMHNIDKRIGDLEQDSYYFHMYEADKESLSRDFTNKAEQSGRQTPIFSDLDPDNNLASNYHRKRRASSPARDLRNSQEVLHSRIDAMGETMNTISSTLMELAQFNDTSNNDDTPPSQSDQ
jgi:hypothetical protein